MIKNMFLSTIKILAAFLIFISSSNSAEIELNSTSNSIVDGKPNKISEEAHNHDNTEVKLIEDITSNVQEPGLITIEPKFSTSRPRGQ